MHNLEICDLATYTVQVAKVNKTYLTPIEKRPYTVIYLRNERAGGCWWWTWTDGTEIEDGVLAHTLEAEFQSACVSRD